MILPDLGRFIYIIHNSRVQALFLFQGKFNYEIQKCSCSIIKGMKFFFFINKQFMRRVSEVRY